jgi:predicted O-methyltransferase YrrM
MPWWSFGAVKFVGARLKAGSEVFEFGSGGSTIFMGSRARSVTCVEDDIGWTQLVSTAAAERGLSGVSVLHRPFDFWKTETFGNSDYLLSLSGKTFDVIVVDGQEWSDQVRDKCFWRAEDYIRKGGIIVLDDSWRYPQVKSRNRALRWREYKGAGYCRVGVTSTCVFEY